jgi:hypothetical protein
LRSICHNSVDLFVRASQSRRQEEAHPGPRGVYALLNASAENRPSVARFMRERLERLIREPRHRARALVLALYTMKFDRGLAIDQPSLSPAARQFWEKEVEDNRVLFDPALRLEGERSYWAAVDLMTHGALPLDEVLVRFGAGWLFEFTRAGEDFGPPIGYQLITPSGATLARDMRYGISMNSLARLLPRQKTPWFSMNNEDHVTSLSACANFAFRFHSIGYADAAYLSVYALLGAAVIEFARETGRVDEALGYSQSEEGSIGHMLAALFRDERLTSRRPSSPTDLNAVPLTRETRTLLRKWARGEVQFVDGLTRV